MNDSVLNQVLHVKKIYSIKEFLNPPDIENLRQLAWQPFKKRDMIMKEMKRRLEKRG